MEFICKGVMARGGAVSYVLMLLDQRGGCMEYELILFPRKPSPQVFREANKWSFFEC